MVGELDRADQINEFLTRAVDSVYPSAETLEGALNHGGTLKAYLGVDPTGSELHIGHASQLQKLRRLQLMGHQAVLLIGDFTAMIGDPTDKSAARVALSRDQVMANAATYKDQAAKILDFDDPKNPAQLQFNSTWLGEMKFADVVQLASEATVQQLMARDMFQRRVAENKPVYVHELLYPLMQGQDSVAMGVDIEIGGSDQIFNMLVGRDLARRRLGKEKYVVGGRLLVDPSGRKMGKTEGNMVTMRDTPQAMFHKIMMWSDQIVPHALEVATTVPMDQIAQIEQDIKEGRLDPLQSKVMLARRVVQEFHSVEASLIADETYQQNAQGIDTGRAATLELSSGSSIVDALVAAGLATSRRAARTLIEQRGVRLNGVTVEDPTFQFQEGALLQAGKKTEGSFRKVTINKP